MGAATSPVVSNLLCLDLDQALIDIAKTYDLVYTRYADDLTFSSDHTIYPDEIEAIKNIIYLSGFRVNEKKFRLQSKHGRQSVTGIKVNQKLNVDRRYIRKIRALIHDAHLNGIANAASKHFGARSSNDRLTKHFWLRLEGKINFVGQVRGKDDMVYNKLKQGFYSLGMNAHAEGLI